MSSPPSQPPPEPDASSEALGLPSEAVSDSDIGLPPGPAKAAAAAGDSLVGQRLNAYRLEELLGRGAMGSVYRAVDTTLQREVALKVIDLGAYADRPKVLTSAIQQFIREARSGARLNHPHIVKVLQIAEAGGHYYIAMELLRGGDLAQRAFRSRSLMPADICRLVAQAGWALHHAHAHGVVHRDLKPQNLMLDAEGLCRVVDFGLARLEGDQFRLPAEKVGTPYYMAPEVLDGQPATALSDQFSLGATLLALLAGRTPFDRGWTRAQVLAHRKANPYPSPDSLGLTVSAGVAEVIRRSTRNDPAARFPDCAAFAAALEAAMPGANVPAPATVVGAAPAPIAPAALVPPASAPAAPAGHRFPWGAFLGGLGFGLAAGAVVGWLIARL